MPWDADIGADHCLGEDAASLESGEIEPLDDQDVLDPGCQELDDLQQGPSIVPPIGDNRGPDGEQTDVFDVEELAELAQIDELKLSMFSNAFVILHKSPPASTTLIYILRSIYTLLLAIPLKKHIILSTKLFFADIPRMTSCHMIKSSAA